MANRINTTISELSEIRTDDNGFDFIDVTLEDGSKGYYPGKGSTLSTFKVGSKVTYSGTKIFNGRSKINGLMLDSNSEKKKDQVEVKARIVDTSEVAFINGWYSKSISLDNGTAANVVSRQAPHISQYRVGNIVSYTTIQEASGIGTFFSDLKKEFEYSADDRRNISIMRQSCLKVAVELYLKTDQLSGNKSKGGAVDWDKAFKEITTLSDKFVKYVSVD